MLQERRRRLSQNPIDFYRALPHQAAFHGSLSRERGFIGSNRCGKSEGGVMETMRTATGQNPHRKSRRVPNDGWVVSVTNEAQREILQPKFEKIMGPYIKGEPIKRPHGVWDKIILRNGSTIGFKSCEMSVKTFQGTNLDYVWFDEEPDYAIFRECKARLLDRKGDLWVTMTPLYGMDWSYDYFVDKEKKSKDAQVFTASMWDNAKSKGGYLDDEEIRRFEDSIPDPIERRIRVYGEYLNQAGRIYKQFDRNIHCLEQLPRHFVQQDGTMSPHFDYYVVIDTGRAFAAGYFLVDYLANVVMFDEYFATDKPLSENCRRIHNMNNIYGIAPTYICDPSSQFFVDLAEHGLNCQHGDNDVEKGIGVVQEYMAFRPQPENRIGLKYSNPRLYFLEPKVPRCMYELQRYVWENPATSGNAEGELKNKPKKKDDHVMDALRYMIVQKPDPPKPPVGEEDRRPMTDQIRDHAKAKFYQEKSDNPRNGDDPFGLDSW